MKEGDRRAERSAMKRDRGIESRKLGWMGGSSCDRYGEGECVLGGEPGGGAYRGEAPVLFSVICGGMGSGSGGGLGECGGGGGGGAGDDGGDGESVSRSMIGSNSGAEEAWEGPGCARGVFFAGGDGGGLLNGFAELEAMEAPVGIGVRFGVRNGLWADIGFAISS